MTMIKGAPFKELTVKQYEFYKRKGMTDERVMNIHGYKVVTLNDWKKKHDLIGVKFEKDVTVTEGKLLREKEVAPERGPSSSSVDSKTPTISQAEVMERHNSQNNALNSHESDSKPTGDKILASDLQRLGTSIDADLAKRVDLDKFQHEENQEYIAELLDEVAGKAEKIEEERENARGWEEKYRKEYECSAMWRDRFLDMERQKNKLEQTVSVEVSNRKYAEKLMDDALIAAHRDDELLALLAEKFVTNRKKNLEVG